MVKVKGKSGKMLPVKPVLGKMLGMEKAEIEEIAAFLGDVKEGLCEGDERATMELQLSELCRIIRRLMDETFRTQDQQLKVLLASLELRAREYKEHIERRLAVRN